MPSWKVLIPALGLAALASCAILGPGEKTIGDVTGPARSIKIKAKVLADLQLDAELPGAGFENRRFRTRYWDIKPGGIVPLHSHDGRPATIYVVNGEILEFADGAAEPKCHRGGEISVESQGLVHHWRNDTDETVHLVASDIHKKGGRGKSAPPAVRTMNAPATPAGFEAETLAEIALDGENIGVTSGALRTRRITLAPGGRTAAGAGASGPILAYVLEGAVREHRADAAEPVARTAGDQATVRAGVTAYWENAGAAPAVMLISDIAGLD